MIDQTDFFFPSFSTQRLQIRKEKKALESQKSICKISEQNCEKSLEKNLIISTLMNDEKNLNSTRSYE